MNMNAYRNEIARMSLLDLDVEIETLNQEKSWRSEEAAECELQGFADDAVAHRVAIWQINQKTRIAEEVHREMRKATFRPFSYQPFLALKGRK